MYVFKCHSVSIFSITIGVYKPCQFEWAAREASYVCCTIHWITAAWNMTSSPAKTSERLLKIKETHSQLHTILSWFTKHICLIFTWNLSWLVKIGLIWKRYFAKLRWGMIPWRNWRRCPLLPLKETLHMYRVEALGVFQNWHIILMPQWLLEVLLTNYNFFKFKNEYCC